MEHSSSSDGDQSLGEKQPAKVTTVPPRLSAGSARGGLVAIAIRQPSSAGSPFYSKPTSPPSSSSGGGGNNTLSSSRKRKLERRGHTKSRNGCSSCKRRRIKCQETRPACAHCIKSGYKCEYPAGPPPRLLHEPSLYVQPASRVPLFTLQDMRLFQHFLQNCYPQYPLGNQRIWTHEVPCLAQNYEYLMHAMLGLAASELLATDASLIEPAMAHRLRALRAISRRLACVSSSPPPAAATTTSSSDSGPATAASTSKVLLADSPSDRNNGSSSNNSNLLSYQEGNALLATCFALTFQSIILEDGMAEYMTFMRGLVLVAIQMSCAGIGIMFANFTDGGAEQEATVRKLLDGIKLAPEVRVWTADAKIALVQLKPLCVGVGDELKQRNWEALMDVVKGLEMAPFPAWSAMASHYSWWMTLPHHDFARIIDPTNQTFLLLATHWIALKQAIGPAIGAHIKPTLDNDESTTEPPHNRPQGGPSRWLRWLRWLNTLVDTEHQHFNKWPVWVEAQANRDPSLETTEEHRYQAHQQTLKQKQQSTSPIDALAIITGPFSSYSSRKRTKQ